MMVWCDWLTDCLNDWLTDCLTDWSRCYVLTIPFVFSWRILRIFDHSFHLNPWNPFAPHRRWAREGNWAPPILQARYETYTLIRVLLLRLTTTVRYLCSWICEANKSSFFSFETDPIRYGIVTFFCGIFLPLFFLWSERRWSAYNSSSEFVLPSIWKSRKNEIELTAESEIIRNES